MFTHQQKREPALMQGNNSRETVFWLAVTEFSLSPCVFVGVGLLTLAWQLLGASWLGGTLQRFLHSYTSAVLGSDDWHSANSHQHLPNNGARALMNVIVMLDPHNIWKPGTWNPPLSDRVQQIFSFAILQSELHWCFSNVWPSFNFCKHCW